MTFLDRYVQGEFGTEEKKVVMDKTVSVSSDPSDEKVKVDHLDSDNTLEKDILKQQKAERDITGTVALPLFRFEDKQKKEIIVLMNQIADVAAEEIKNNIGAPYTPLFGYVNVLKKADINHMVDLTISRNKEIFNTSAKEFEIEVVTCYFDKKLRIKNNITEDKVIDEKVDVEYTMVKHSIYTAMQKLLNTIIERIKLKGTGTEKDIQIYLAESAGDENYGTGYSIFIKYNKLIDYTNYKRGKENYDMFSGLLDEDFSKSLESEKNCSNIEEQISISLSKSMEAIADGMTENSDDQNDSENDEEGNNEDGSADDSNPEDEFNDDSDGGDESGDGDDMGDDGMGGDDDGGDEGDSDSSNDSSSSSSDDKITPGQNPYADVNSRNKVSIEFNELKDQIDKVLLKLNQFKSTVVVNKLVELDNLVKDALKNSYTVPLQDSLMRYSLYATQFGDLISELTREFEANKER